MNRFCTLFVVFVTLSVSGLRAQISGRVIDATNGESISSASVVLKKNGVTADYAITKQDGSFSLKAVSPPFVLNIRHVSYEPLSLTDKEYESDTNHLIRLKSKELELDQVIVTAPVIKQIGDTIRYRLKAYASSSDLNIEDVLKKLPGVSVSKSGTISYLGKEIDKLTIDGMDLTDNRYDIATRNLSHEMVGNVEILENQQEIKQLQGLVGDDKLVMNIVLNQKAKNKIRGRLDESVGAEKEKTIHYSGLTAMLFKPSMQILLTSFYNDNIKEHSTSVRNIGDQVLALMPLSQKQTSVDIPKPKLSEQLFLNRRDLSTNVNTMFRLADKSTLRVIASYSKNREEYQSETILQYLATGKIANITIEEQAFSSLKSQNPTMSVEYAKNTDHVFIRNKVVYDGWKKSQDYLLSNLSTPINQQRNQDRHSFANFFSLTKRNRQNTLAISSKFQYDHYPLWDIHVNEREQVFSGNSTYGDCTVTPSWNLWHNWRFSSPITVRFSGNKLNNATHWGTSDFSYSMNDGCLMSIFAPRIELFSPNFYNFSFSAPLVASWLYIDEKSNDNKHFYRFRFNPVLNFSYTISPAFRISANSYWSHNHGRIDDFIPGLLYLSYRVAEQMSGILSESSTLFCSTTLSFRQPLKEFFSAARFSYERKSYNTMRSDTPSAIQNVLTVTPMNHKSDWYVFGLETSKYFRQIKTKVSLYGLYTHGNSGILRNEKFHFYNYDMIEGQGNINSTPTKWLEIQYGVKIAQNILGIKGMEKQRLLALNQEVKATVSLFESLELSSKAEHLRKEISDNNYSNILIWGANARWKFKKITLDLDAENLLNQSYYSYALFDGLIYREFKHWLRGRSLRLNVSYYF
ncbi:hypothetical protein HMPREF1554_00025 [Porphyromonas gingivalis F0569]|uniref:carboxypeptidase-like regulatory domain-containing protein n=2 Tax=Porphyromonas gingivalis TaxID=837 RepID=UPI0003AD5B19|nr:carboxypeptidase-like regulatory domain-containing protein [Porphyromonas gingivalis]ERJ71690.1 hypothetical protein HMPREF1554_00025 [Porphyromonas gingivalis F0569]